LRSGLPSAPGLAPSAASPGPASERNNRNADSATPGREIDAVFIDALYRAFDEDQEPADLTIAELLTDFVPLCRTMADQITGLRTRAKGRARFATSPQTERRLRKLAA
jgi:hypothetical protein